MTNKTHPRPALDSWASIEGWSTAPDRGQFEEEFNAEGCQEFAQAHLDFPFCDFSAEKMKDFLYRWPFSRKNLEIAWNTLDVGRITQVEAPPEPKTTRTNSVVAAQVAPLSEEESEALERLRDIPYLSDTQRRIRDEKLRQAAILSRNTRRKHHASALIG